MPHAVSTPSPGLQALILCGPGSSFPTFTANPDENPKALLPIANRPMVWYPLEFCYRTGITDITLICPPSAKETIGRALKTNPFLTGLPHPHPDLVAPEDLDYTTGTAEILRLPQVQEVINSDFVVLPCDLVCELGGDKLLQAWMVKAASVPTLKDDGSTASLSGALGVYYETKTATPVKGEETDFIATTPLSRSGSVPPPKDSLLQSLSNLVLSMPTDSLSDVLEEKNSLPIRHGLLRRHPNLRMLTSHRDAHIYIFPQWVKDFVMENERLESIGEDIVGNWAKASWQAGFAEKLGLRKVLDAHVKAIKASNSSAHGTGAEDTELASSVHLQQSSDRETGGDLQKSTLESSAAKVEQPDLPSVVAYIHPSGASAPVIRRVDTAPLLLSVSLQLAKLPSIEETGPETASPFAHAKKVAYPDGVKSRTTITKADSLIADNVMVEEKTSIKETVIGANCQIKEGAKLVQCLLMDGVVVGKGCKLTRCILGRRSEIGEGSTLTDCEVQENLLVEPKTEEKESKLMSSDGLEATDAELQEALQDDEQMDEEDDGSFA